MEAGPGRRLLSVRCGRCRVSLVTCPPAQLVEAEELIHLLEDNLPEWVQQAVEEGGWTKGKLQCFSCQAKVGGFDFVSRAVSLSPLHLVRSKVDPVYEDRSAPSSIAMSDTRREANTGPSQDSSEDDLEEDDNPQATSEDHEASLEDSSDSSSPAPQPVSLRSKRQKEKVRLARRRREGLERERTREKEVQRENAKREAKVKELLEAEPELTLLPDDKICPVCLDLLHEPFQVEPCGHIFCEPCLRRLGEKNPMNCSCPLCRTKIGFCKHLAATSREIREDHEALYLKRKKFERSTPVFSYPLPWQPGWRNLIRGRPLGGNRFLIRDNRAELMRALVHQIPYYIPPVMIANLINVGIFAFMMGVIEVFPNILSLFMGTQRNLSLAGNGTDGDLSPSPAGATHPEEPAVEVVGLNQEHKKEAPVEAIDATFYYVFFMLSIVAAILSQLYRGNHIPGHQRLHRLTDFIHVLLLTVVPLLILPSFVTIGGGTGSWIGSLIEKAATFVFHHLNYHTAVLLCFTVWFIYHVDVNEDALF